jgi:hypothetical protein
MQIYLPLSSGNTYIIPFWETGIVFVFYEVLHLENVLHHFATIILRVVIDDDYFALNML